MQRINTSYFYRLAQKLLPLKSIEGNMELYFDGYSILRDASQELGFFLANPLMPPHTCLQNGQSLYELVTKIVEEEYKPQRKIEWGEAISIKEALSHFEISLQSDFGTRDTFIVSQKAAFSTTILAERGATAVSEQCLILVPEIASDLADGCRCLAFELPTAAAFHLFRAVEAMVRAYGEFVRQKPFTSQEKKRGLGGYANYLKQSTFRVDERIIHSIEQIASLHRNPTMHPEMHISKTEIMATLGMVISLIETLALDWKRREDTPEIPLIEVLPDDSKVSALIGVEEEGKPRDGETRSGKEGTESRKGVKRGKRKLNSEETPS